MKALLLKDFYMVQKYCRSFLLVLVVFLVVSCFGDNNTFFVIYPVLFAGMIPVTLISYDEREKWHIYSETMPYTRAQFVSAKYIIGLSLESVVFLLTVAAQAFRMSSAGALTASAFFPLAMSILVIGLVAPALLLPFIFRFGAEKGRVAYYIVLGAICAGGTVLAGSGMKWPQWLSTQWVLLFILLIAVTVYICSWGLSILFYKNREL